jgi:hypothetical protein
MNGSTPRASGSSSTEALQQGIKASWPLGGVFAVNGRSMPVAQYPWRRDVPARSGIRALAQRAKLRHQYAARQTSRRLRDVPPRRREYIGTRPTSATSSAKYAKRRAENIRVRFYFSLIDWSPDYRASESDKPYVFAKWRKPTPRMGAIADMFEQITDCSELVDVIWFDGGWERNAERWKSGAGGDDPSCSRASSSTTGCRASATTGDGAVRAVKPPARVEDARAVYNRHEMIAAALIHTLCGSRGAA